MTSFDFFLQKCDFFATAPANVIAAYIDKSLWRVWLEACARTEADILNTSCNA